MFSDVNFLFGILVIMLFASVIIDGIALYNIWIKRTSDAVAFACTGLKWLKIILVYFLGAVMLYYSFTVANAPLMTVGEFVLGLLLIADGVLSTVTKIKYGGKK